MKTLSFIQPWATLVAIGAKRIETRSFSLGYHGPIAIHASKGFPRWAIELCFAEPFRSALSAAGIKQPADLPRGAVLATANLVDVVPIRGVHDTSYRPLWCAVVDPDYRQCEFPAYSVVARLSVGNGLPQSFGQDESSFGDYTPGRWAWILDDAKPLPEPIPAKGAPGLWEWNRIVLVFT